MATKVEFTTEVEVGIEALWNALTKDRLSVGLKAANPQLLDAQLLEGDGGLGTISHFTPGYAASHVPPFKDKVVEFDEKEHAFGTQMIEGGYLKLGFASCVVSFKLDDKGEGKTSVTGAITYEVENEADGKALAEDLKKVSGKYLEDVLSVLQKSDA